MSDVIKATETLDGQYVVNVTKLSFGMVLRLTLCLRWSKQGKLQQAWQNVHGPEVQWQDVPTEDDESAAPTTHGE